MAENQLDPQRWVDEHGDALFGYAMIRLRNPELAEDVVQETFMAALRGRDSYAGRASERTWLISILKRKIIDYFRKRREITASELSADDDADSLVGAMFDQSGMWKSNKPMTWTDPVGSLREKDFMKILRECLAGLPGRLADAFTLREMEQIPSEEVCQILGITSSNLWQMLYRSRVRLRRCLEVKWFEKHD